MIKLWKSDSFIANLWYSIPTAIRYPINSYQRRKFIKQFSVGIVVEDCRYHPVVINSIDKEGDIECTNLLTGTRGIQCSLFHCGIRKMTSEEVTRCFEDYYRCGSLEEYDKYMFHKSQEKDNEV